MKTKGKQIGLMLIALSFVSGCNNAFFEVDTKVQLVVGSNPPTFKITGNGSSPIFLVFGPYEGEYGKDGNPPPLWELDPIGRARNAEVSQYSPFVYGKIPADFVQGKPKEGQIPVLQEGKEYNFYVHVNSANGGGVCFRIKNGSAVLCQ